MSAIKTPLNARDLEIAIKIDLETGICPLIGGPPGIGKTALMNTIAEDAELLLLAEHLSSKEPTDLNGLPDVSGDFAVFKTFENFPTAAFGKVPATKKPINPKTGREYRGWLLFLDELRSASIETQVAAYPFILEGKVGNKKLHEDVFMAAASNRAVDNAMVNRMSSALTSRVVHYEMLFDPHIFLEDVVGRYNWNWKVAAYLEFNPQAAHQFNPEHAEDPYACPRTWDFLQRRITIQENADGYDNRARHNRASAEGLVGTEIAREFLAFIDTFGLIPSMDDIIYSPDSTPIPESRGLQFATVVQCRKEVVAANLNEVYRYISRFDPEFKLTFVRGILSDPSKGIAISHPAIIDARKNLRKRA